MATWVLATTHMASGRSFFNNLQADFEGEEKASYPTGTLPAS
jgi:hypothetical protein